MINGRKLNFSNAVLFPSKVALRMRLKAIFRCSRFARAGGATNFNHVKNQSPEHAKKVECSSTFMACPRAFRRTKNAQVRQLQKKLSNVRSARAGKATAMENCLKAAVTLALESCLLELNPLESLNNLQPSSLNNLQL
jgi:uncharacterized protein YlxW (UPF0749 family)